MNYLFNYINGDVQKEWLESFLNYKGADKYFVITEDPDKFRSMDSSDVVCSLNLRRGIYPGSVKILKYISEQQYEVIAKYIPNWISWLEATDDYCYSYSDRYSYIYNNLNFWLNFIEQKKVDCVINYTWPHLPSDYGLYLISRFIYKVPCIFFDITPFFDANSHLINHKLDDLSYPIERVMMSKEFRSSRISSETRIYLNKLRSSKPIAPRHVTSYFSVLDREESRRPIKFLKLIFEIFSLRAFEDSGTSIVSPVNASKGRFMNKLELFIFREKLRKKNISIRKYYKKLLSQSVPERNYIYFAAPYQPEAISNLVQGNFQNVFLILSMLRTAFPSTPIIYKEHPNTFKTYDKGGLSRSIEFYEEIKSLEEIYFVSENVPTFELVDGCMVVATVGGTVGWEAINRRKRALVFGTQWYSCCEGVHKISSIDDLLSVRDIIMSNHGVNLQIIDNFVSAVEQVCVKNFPSATSIYKQDKFDTSISTWSLINQHLDKYIGELNEDQ